MVLLAVAVVWLAKTGSAQGPEGLELFEFALIGDLGYTPAQEILFLNLIEDLNGTPNLAFVVHDGDLWGDPTGPCSDERYADRLALFQSSAHPLIYTPGDNEWTDCWQERFGGYDQLDRLRRVREVFFPDEFSLGRRRIRLTRQSENPQYATYRENARWTWGGG